MTTKPETCPPCPICEGSGYIEDAARETLTCPGCDGTGEGARCACGACDVPAGSGVTHDEGDPGNGDGEAVHTQDRCAVFSARDGWSETDWEGATGRSMDMPEWCEEYTSAR